MDAFILESILDLLCSHKVIFFHHSNYLLLIHKKSVFVYQFIFCHGHNPPATQHCSSYCTSYHLQRETIISPNSLAKRCKPVFCHPVSSWCPYSPLQILLERHLLVEWLQPCSSFNETLQFSSGPVRTCFSFYLDMLIFGIKLFYMYQIYFCDFWPSVACSSI